MLSPPRKQVTTFVSGTTNKRPKLEDQDAMTKEGALLISPLMELTGTSIVA
jgi:hypothetical protein